MESFKEKMGVLLSKQEEEAGKKEYSHLLYLKRVDALKAVSPQLRWVKQGFNGMIGLGSFKKKNRAGHEHKDMYYINWPGGVEQKKEGLPVKVPDSPFCLTLEDEEGAVFELGNFRSRGQAVRYAEKSNRKRHNTFYQGREEQR